MIRPYREQTHRMVVVSNIKVVLNLKNSDK